MRPSGTEPKIKFYFSVKEELKDNNQFDKVNAMLEERIDGIIKSLKIR